MKKRGGLFLVIILIAVFIAAGNSNKHEDPHSFTPVSKKGNKTAQLISEKRSYNDFRSVDLFNFVKNVSDGDNSSEFVKNASKLTIRKEKVEEILNSRREDILLRIPVSPGLYTELELTQSSPVTQDFTLITKDAHGSKIIPYENGLHYTGIIKGNENSIASISIFNEFIMGVISDETGNHNLGPVKNDNGSYSENYIYYNDRDLLNVSSFKCDVEKFEEKMVRPLQQELNSGNQNSGIDNPARLPVKVYFETDYQMYLDFQGNSTNVGNFVTGMFNVVKGIYFNEGIITEVSQVGIWTVADPYRTLDDSYYILTRFGGLTKDDFQGNLGHLLSTRRAGLGGIAWIRVLCSQYNPSDSAGRFAFSNIDTNYKSLPNYSWTINVVTHEMGHNLGSRHTHACVWPTLQGGGIGSIDSCYIAEGGCFTVRRPRIGTIMSYCHLWTIQQGGGINLNSGFGQLPGDTIRLRYNQAACLDRLQNSSEAPVVYDLSQNFPNPFNPSTVIKFDIPAPSHVDLRVYDINGRLVAVLIQNKLYSEGSHPFEFNASAYNLSSGIYFYTFSASGENAKFTETKRMILIK